VAQLARRRPGTITSFADVALTALASADERAARDFVAAELGPLAAEDEDTRRLAETLCAYLEERSSPPDRAPPRRAREHDQEPHPRDRGTRGRPADERIAETLVALRLTRLVGLD